MGNSSILISTDRHHYHVPFAKSLLHYKDRVDTSYNRVIDHDRVAEFTQFQLEWRSKYNRIFPIGVIVICVLNNKYYVIDGQHRMMTYISLLNDGIEDPMSYLTFEVNKVSDEQTIRNLFQLYNKSVPVPEYAFLSKKDVIDKINRIIKSKWKSHLSKSPKHHSHTIHVDQFCDFLSDYDLVESTWDDKMCEETLIKWNNLCARLLKERKLRGIGVDRCREKNFYLGLYRDNENEISAYLRKGYM